MNIEKKINKDRKKLIKLLSNFDIQLEYIRFRKNKKGVYELIIELGGK